MANMSRTYLVLLVLSANCVLQLVGGNNIKFTRKPLKVYWNVPSFQCNVFPFNFTRLLDKYNIVQNEKAAFRGNEINILYDPGDFPAILNKGDQVFIRNGGVPQEGNLTYHLDIFTEIVEKLIPNENFSGIAIIDFESWRPIYRQNWGTLAAYKNLTEQIERQKHPSWSTAWIIKEGTRRFESAARTFIEETIALAKSLRPNASWGYYHYPYCFNNGNNTTCPKEVVQENDKIKWLFDISDNLYPSLYLQEGQTIDQRIRYIESSLDEAKRIDKAEETTKLIYPYIWYKFQDTGNYMNKQDLFTMLTVIASYETEGVILWGASADVNSYLRCQQLYNYIDKVFGPTVIHV